MPDAYSYSTGQSLKAIERPSCPKCQSRMSLARIMPGPSGHDPRTFECSKCRQVFKEMVATDPMQSDNRGWLAGGLKPPK
jgi:hypothetical protein